MRAFSDQNQSRVLRMQQNMLETWLLKKNTTNGRDNYRWNTGRTMKSGLTLYSTLFIVSTFNSFRQFFRSMGCRWLQEYSSAKSLACLAGFSVEGTSAQSDKVVPLWQIAYWNNPFDLSQRRDEIRLNLLWIFQIIDDGY